LVREVLASNFRNVIKGTMYLRNNKWLHLYGQNLVAEKSSIPLSLNMRYCYLTKDLDFSISTNDYPSELLECSKEDILKFLNDSVKSEYLDDDFCSIIDSSQSACKPVVIPDELNSELSPIAFDVDEQDKEIVLARRLIDKKKK
jgi:hypothetical protein